MTLQEQMRANKRMIDRSIRELDRERTSLQNQEKKLIADIKKTAKAGQMGAVTVMAKDLVRTRRFVTKFYEMRSQLQAVSLRLQTIKSTEAMTGAMKGVTKAMVSMNKQMNLPALNKIMTEFLQESEKMDITEEMVGDSIDMVMEQDGDEEESNKITAQVLEEIGVEMNGQLGEVSAATLEAPKQAVAEKAGNMDQELEARLNNLRR
eukprot:GILK01003554.1.p1 GENE.GILK01003554.1~~GILK01003554.1.p1  ORF type:complete len:228 (+),score=47.47 GILK01003554.1:66-686(+)